MNSRERAEALERLARQRAVHGWAFRGLPQEENDAISAFLHGKGPCPEGYRGTYRLCRKHLKLGPKDWYEAFGEAVHSIGKQWPMDLTEAEEKYCEEFADSMADRPECEK